MRYLGLHDYPTAARHTEAMRAQAQVLEGALGSIPVRPVVSCRLAESESGSAAEGLRPTAFCTILYVLSAVLLVASLARALWVYASHRTRKIKQS
jgi:hypothetical protein